ncbi:DUF2255 family protein, partial [Pseudonocardia pini]|uniref:DUF2255 family protein n=1 Tax=Pseudonocardia pini TaxID=2758030 RepID=UPI001C69052B
HPSPVRPAVADPRPDAHDHGMAAKWTSDELATIDAADELHVAVPLADGTLRRAVPVWVVRVGGEVFVRTWHRRDTGWYGRAVATSRARVRVPGVVLPDVDLPGVEVDVTVEDVGADRREAVDAAYRDKYARYGGSAERMTEDDAAATTLRLVPTDA